MNGLMDAHDVAQYLRYVDRKTGEPKPESAMRFIRKRGVPRFRVGQRWLMKQTDVDKAVEGHTFRGAK
jgi:hypothetical protein